MSPLLSAHSIVEGLGRSSATCEFLAQNPHGPCGPGAGYFINLHPCSHAKNYHSATT